MKTLEITTQDAMNLMAAYNELMGASLAGHVAMAIVRNRQILSPIISAAQQVMMAGGNQDDALEYKESVDLRPLHVKDLEKAIFKPFALAILVEYGLVEDDEK